MSTLINKALHILRFGRLNRDLSWQARKDNSNCKAALINNELSHMSALSVLDIGCNAGQVSRLLSSDRFVVGIDIELHDKPSCILGCLIQHPLAFWGLSVAL